MTYPSFQDIIYFIEAANTLNVSRASEILGISQPSLSVALKRLENCLDNQLFIRSKTGLQLTKSGRAFLVKARDLQQQWRLIHSDLNAISEEAVGNYSIGCHVSVGQYSLHKFLPKLTKKYPGLNFQLVHALSREVCEKVISYEVDFGLVINPVQHPDLIIKSLSTDVVGFWHAASIAKENLSTLILDQSLNQSQSLLQKIKKSKLKFERTITSSSLEVIASLTGHGAGVGLLPQKVAEAFTGKKIVPFGNNMPVFNDKLCLVTRADQPKTFSSKIIKEAITKNIAS